MKKQLLALTISLLTLSVSGQITFEKTYGGTDMDFGYSVRQTTDNGYILLGSTESFSTSRDIFLIKTDQYGDTLWTKTYGGSNFDEGHEVKQTMDGGYIICGIKDLKTFIIKTNNIGDTMWTKAYIGMGWSVEQIPDSGYIIAGGIWLGGANYDMLLIKINSSGDTLWTKTYGNNQAQECRDIKQTNDGGYILTGYTVSGSTSDIYLVKTDSIGDTLWTRSFGGSGYEEAYSVEQTSDNGYIVLGNSNSFCGYKFYLIKTDVNGDTLWTKTYDNGNSNDEGYEVKQTSDGGYVFVAETDKNGLPYEQVYLVKTNGTGDTLWTQTYNQGSGVGLQITSDGGYIIIGFTGSFGAGMDDVYLIKTDANGNAMGITESPNNFTCFHIFPNPFSSTTTLHSDNFIRSATLTVYDSFRQTVKQIKNITGQTINLHRENLSSGLYFLQLTQENKIIATEKLVITD